MVEDTLYNEECKVDVQHICEEHITVPVYNQPHHISIPVYNQPQPHVYPNPSHNTQNYHKIPKESYEHSLPPKKPIYNPPITKYPTREKGLKNRKKREDTNNFDSYDATNTKTKDKRLTDIVRQIMLEVIEKDQSLGEVNATIISPKSSDLRLHIALPESRKPRAESSPVISTHELPAPYGCRTIATKICYQVPMVVPKRVPYEKCKNIPSVECAIVLKEVPELECVPKLFEECMDVAQETPFLAPDEECEEVAYDECVEVSITTKYETNLKIVLSRLRKEYPWSCVRGRE